MFRDFHGQPTDGYVDFDPLSRQPGVWTAGIGVDLRHHVVQKMVFSVKTILPSSVMLYPSR
jgi:hypothetical protein